MVYSSLISDYYKTPRIFTYKSLYGYSMYLGVDFLNDMFGMFCLFNKLKNDFPKQLWVSFEGQGMRVAVTTYFCQCLILLSTLAIIRTL